MKFELLRKKAIEEVNGYEERTVAELHEGNDYTIRYYLTDLRIKQLADGKITKEQAILLAIKKARKEYEKQRVQAISKIEQVEQAEDIKQINVCLEYFTNSPMAYCYTAHTGRTEGRAGGWGYDRPSAAVASAFNDNVCILKILYAMKEAALQQNADISSHDACGYGAGYGALPYYEGGVGLSCFERILNSAGFKLSQIHGKNSSSYMFAKD